MSVSFLSGVFAPVRRFAARRGGVPLLVLFVTVALIALLVATRPRLVPEPHAERVWPVKSVAISRQTGWSYSRVVKLHADAGLQPSVDAQREASRQVNRLRRAYDVAARQEALGPGPFAAAFAEGFRGQVAKADLLDLRPSVCRFPIDRAAGGVGYCGSATHGTSVYCLDHHALCTRRRETH